MQTVRNRAQTAAVDSGHTGTPEAVGIPPWHHSFVICCKPWCRVFTFIFSFDIDNFISPGNNTQRTINSYHQWQTWHCGDILFKLTVTTSHHNINLRTEKQPGARPIATWIKDMPSDADATQRKSRAQKSLCPWSFSNDAWTACSLVKTKACPRKTRRQGQGCPWFRSGTFQAI